MPVNRAHNPPRRSGHVGGYDMPRYLFVEDVLEPFLRRPVKPSTKRTYAKCAKHLIAHFGGMWCTDSRRSTKTVIDGVKVAKAREAMKLGGLKVASVKLVLSVGSAACGWDESCSRQEAGHVTNARLIRQPKEKATVMAGLWRDLPSLPARIASSVRAWWNRLDTPDLGPGGL